jgi:hypothetical protein
MNLLYKLFGNGLYGVVARGLSETLKFDIGTGSMQRMGASDLSNPALASPITAIIFIISFRPDNTGSFY